MRELRTYALPGYVVGTILLTIYGGCVCPAMLGESKLLLATLIGAGCALALGLEALLLPRLRRMGKGPRWEVEWALWLIPGLGGGAYNVVVLGFPLASGAKLLLGAIVFGCFASYDRSLKAEHDAIETGGIDVSKESYLSIAQRITTFTIIANALLVIVMTLVIIKATDDMKENTFGWKTPYLITLEAATVTIAIAFGMVRVVRRYRGYFQSMFTAETQVLEAVASGDLSRNVPVVSRDEFGQIAERTNSMIEGLRERERIRSAFGKFVDPKVAAKLLAAGDIKLGGEHRDVAILFADLRGYTSLSEKLSAEQVVAVLNQYFTRMVAAITAHGGRVDKFIGDAVMAEFGLLGEPEPCAAAMRTAVAMRDALREIRADLRRRGLPEIDNGIGIHFGTAIAGQIGSDERLEYTVIGDCVNVASRLESLTRKIESPIAISTAVYDNLPEELRHGLMNVGEHELKGKSLPIAVYGVVADGERKVVTAS